MENVMGELSIAHWLIVLLIVIVVFGAGKLKHIGSDLGHAIKNFKKSMHEDDSSGAKNVNASVVEHKPLGKLPQDKTEV